MHQGVVQLQPKIDAPGGVCKKYRCTRGCFQKKSMHQGVNSKIFDAPGVGFKKYRCNIRGRVHWKLRSWDVCHGPKNCIDLGTDPQHKSQCNGRGGVHWKPCFTEVGIYFDLGLPQKNRSLHQKTKVFNATDGGECIENYVEGQHKSQCTF